MAYSSTCVEDYDMIHAGDKIAVGVSGGKDSLVLLYAMAPLSFRPVTNKAFLRRSIKQI